MKLIKTSELQIGDTVARQDDVDAFSTCIINQIKDGMIHIFRPYGTTADFLCTGGVIPYVGIEHYQIETSASGMWILYRRRELK